MQKEHHRTARGSMDFFYDIANDLLKTKKTLEDIFIISAVKCKKYSNRAAFIYEENGKKKTLKYKDYYKEVLKYASSLSKELNDIEKDSFVALKMANSIKWPLLFWGLLASGYKPLLINSILDKEATEKLLKEADAKAIIINEEKPYSIKSINVNKLTIRIENFEPIWANEVAFCTSGTTADSRIFVYDGEALTYQIYSAYCMPYSTADIMYVGNIRLIAIIPFAHIFGFVAVFLWYTFFKMSIVFPNSLTPNDLLSAIKKYKCTHIYAVPLFWNTVAKKFDQELVKQNEKKRQLVKRFIDYNNDVITVSEAGLAKTNLVRKIIQKKILGPQVVYCIAGGSALSRETLEKINGLGYHLYNGYGMTEIGVTSVELSPNVIQRNKGSVGKALTNVEYKIINNELLVKSPYLHKYRLIKGEKVVQDVDKESFFHTGDIASIDEEGNVYIKGKCKDVIITSNGENIYPEEIETKFNLVDGIENLALISNKDKLILIIQLSSTSKNENLLKDLLSINDSLPLAFKVNEFYISKSALPINSSLKIKRYELEDNFKNKSDDFVLLSNKEEIVTNNLDSKESKEVVNKLLDIFSLELSIEKEKINLNDHIILDLNGDSFSYMSIISDIENQFNIQIESEKIGKLNSINEFASCILKSKN